MKNNKLISVLLALLVCLSMVVSASASSESDVSFTLESSDFRVENFDALVVGAGDQFTVSVNLEANKGFLFAIPRIFFDNKKLELVSAEAVGTGVKVNKLEKEVRVVIGDTKAMFTQTGEVSTAAGTVAKLTFKVLETSEVQTAIELKVSSSFVMGADGKYDCIVSGDVLNVHTITADHVCDETKTVEANNAVEPTCTEAGKATDLLCAHCGAVVTEGEEIAALGHAWDEGVVTTAPTCTVPGVLTHTCGTCGETKEGEPVPATGHAWDEGVITTEPGCSSLGVRTFTCTSCGETKLDEHVPATGEHTYGEWVVKTEPTTEAEGLQVRTCSECGAEESEVIEKLPEAKSNVLLIVIIVVVVLAGAGVAAYFVLKNKKK